MGSGGAHCIATYCVDVVSVNVGDEALTSWYWSGDDYGGPPKHPCSNDVYTPSGLDACDEWVNPQAAVPVCEIPVFDQQPNQVDAVVSDAGWTFGPHVNAENFTLPDAVIGGRTGDLGHLYLPMYP